MGREVEARLVSTSALKAVVSMEAERGIMMLRQVLSAEMVSCASLKEEWLKRKSVLKVECG